MQHSTITVTPDNIVDIARDAVSPSGGFRCEWSTDGRSICTVILCSWRLLLQHYLRHARRVRKQSFGVSCGLPRCNKRTHSSIQELEEHVEIAHMGRVHFPCPFAEGDEGCLRTSTFHRPNQLIDHFLENHSEFNGRSVELPSPMLRNSWRPFRPKLPPPPPLPGALEVACVLLAPMKASRKRYNKSTELMPPPASPHKQSKQISKVVERETSPQLEVPVFDPLPSFPKPVPHDYQVEDLVIWRRPEFLKKDLSRPQRMWDIRYSKDPPKSILYDAFAKRLGSLLAEKS